MKRFVKIILFSCLCISMYGQQNSLDVSGIVTDGDGLPLPGVNVLVKGTSTGTTTDFDGNYSINIPSGSTLQFTYIGFKDQELTVEESGSYTIQLVASADDLEEVVVIGYGAQKRKEITGSVSTVSSETLEELKPVRVEQALQGTVSGVNVTSTSGAPGANLNVRIRGISTNGNSAPLVIIDGYQSELGLLNPNDIETITVLKDAQAAIYGTIGANGVILITTKRGRKNQAPQVSYNVYSGFQETTRKLPLLNATEYAVLLNEAYANGGMALPQPSVANLGKGTDWQEEIFNDAAPQFNHDFNISGGSEKVTYAVSGSHLYQEGIVGGRKSSFRRNTARLALGVDLSDKFTLQTNAIYTYFDRDTFNENGLGSVLFNALNAPPTLPARDASGDFSLVPNTAGLGIEIINPLAQLANTFNDYDFNKLNGNVSLEYEATNALTFTGRVGFNTSNSEGKSFAKQVSYGGKVFDVQRSSVSQERVNDNNYSLDLFGSYTDTFANDHTVTFTGGTTIFKEWGDGLSGTGYDVPNNSWQFADISLAQGTSAEGVRDVGSYAYDERRLSFFGRLQYNYKDKYLFSAILRRDASTKFGPGNKAAYFPSVTAGYLISDESFFPESDFLNFLKIRASYGVLGNDQIGNNGYIGTLSGEATYVFDGSVVNGRAIGVLPNPDLQWEESKKFDVGADLRLFNSKLTIATDYFINTRDNLLIPAIPVSGIVGIAAPGSASPTVNAGSVRNSGFEIALGYDDRFSDDMTFSIDYNLTTLKNEVLEVNNETGFIEQGGFGVGQPPAARMETGFPIGYFYGYRTNGIFQNQAEVDAHPAQLALGANAQPGDLRYEDLNNDGVINSDDRTNIGNPIPKVTMGLNLNFNYKNIDFVAYTFASLGNDLLRNYERVLSDVNRLNYTLDRWTGPGSSTTVPRLTTAATANNVLSDYFVEDASYARIQNMQIGYSIPKNALEPVGVAKCRLYMGVNNLYTFTNYRGYDPSASSGAPIGGGIDYGFYPVPRTYLLGVNLNF